MSTHLILNIINKIILIIFGIYILIIISIMGFSIIEHFYNIIDTLLLNDKSLIQLDLLSKNCFKNLKYTNKDTKDNIYKEYKLENNKLLDNTQIIRKNGIPIKYFNNNNNVMLDLYISDFFWKFSYKTYLTGSITNGKPSYDSIIDSLKIYKVRGIHLDIYSNSKNIGNENAIPVIRTDVLYHNFKSLDFYKSLEYINKYAWKRNEPLFLYLTLNFSSDLIIYNKIYYAITNIFKGRLLNKKYSFNGRNSLYPINKIKMTDAIGKVIIITNKYPTNSKLDLLINGSNTNEISFLTIDKYTPEIADYGGISSKYSPTDFIENTKNNIFMFYSNNDTKTNTLFNSKIDLYNPNIIDCCKYGVQFTMMSLNLPDTYLTDWFNFFNNKSYVVKNEKLRNIEKKKIIIKKKEIKKEIPTNINTGIFIIN